MTDVAGDKRDEAEPSWLYRMWWLASTVAVDHVGENLSWWESALPGLSRRSYRGRTIVWQYLN